MEEKSTTYPHAHLVETCRKNNQKAQMELYALYNKAMYNTAMRIVNSQCEAEDVMQDAFIHAFQKIEQLEDSHKFGSWLKRIVINKSLDEVGRRKTFLPIDVKIDFMVDTSERESPSDLELEYRLEEVKKAMAALPDQYRLILSLHLFEGMGYEEIGDILGLEYNNVRTRYSSARQRLLQEIKTLRKNKLHKEDSYVEY